MGDRVSAAVGQDGRMPTYIAFLRAINLGANRKFPKDAIKAAAESAGFNDVETYINTGNVRVTTGCARGRRSRRRWRRRSWRTAGFEVPTIVFTPTELTAIADEATEFAKDHERACTTSRCSRTSRPPS